MVVDCLFNVVYNRDMFHIILLKLNISQYIAMLVVHFKFQLLFRMQKHEDVLSSHREEL